jgi:cell wall-active antibiotic response 4TMS protein YvqF
MTTFEDAVDRRVWRARRLDRHRNLIGNRVRNPVGRLITGLLIATWGLALLLDNLGLAEAHRALPAVLVIIGVTLLIHRDPARNHYAFWGTAWMFAGIAVYAAQQAWIHVTLWPVILVVFGASLVYRGLQQRGANTL